MRVLIFEPDCGGHRLQYVAAILDALAPLPVSKLLLCQRGIRETEEFSAHLAPLQGGFDIDEGASNTRGMSAYRTGMLRFLDLYKAIARHKPDHVYIPYADGLIQIAGVARALGFSLARPGMEIEALMMRGKFAYDPPPSSMRIRLFAKTLASTPVDIVHHLDPIVYDFLRQRFQAMAGRFRLMPEAVETIDIVDRRIAQMKLGIPQNGKYVGCLGALGAGKGIALLLRAFENAPLAADTRLLLLGKPDRELRLLLDGRFRGLREAGRIIHFDRYVTQDEFHLGLMASDIVCAPYLRQIGSSGIVVRAAAVGRLVLGSQFGWVGRVIRDFELGIACDVQDVPRFATEISRALSLSENYRPGLKAQAFANFHRMENFEWHWTRRLRERLGMGHPEEIVAWQWPKPALAEAS
ncbi:MAG TPA: glycosyltransferase [Steroidobacteraceae bacterium]